MKNLNTINYDFIANAVKFYEEHNFKQIETPWWVTEEISNITKPSMDIQDYKLSVNNKVLVASGEQSFLYLYSKGQLPLGMFQTVTPCFRNEKFGAYHGKYFIKNELICTDDTSINKLEEIISICFSYFEKMNTNNSRLEIIKTDIGHDITCNGVEIGSYGIRECSFIKWIYATGCAEPRLSRALNSKR